MNHAANTKIPEFNNTNVAPDETQILADVTNRYGHDDFFQQNSVLPRWTNEPTAVHPVEPEVPAPRDAEPEDVGLGIFTPLQAPEAPPIPDEAATPRRRRLWPRLGNRAAKETVENPDDRQIVAAEVIEALDKMEVSPTRPSFRERVSGLIDSFKLKLGLLRAGGANFGKFIERHPKAAAAAGVVAVAGLVVNAWFKTRGIELSGQSYAADVADSMQPGGSAGSGVQLETQPAGGAAGSSLEPKAKTVPHPNDYYVPGEDTSDSDSDPKYIPREDAPGTDSDTSYVPRETNAETGPTERLNGSGDTISHHAEQHLIDQGNPNPNWDQIRVETQRILDLNGLSWDDARNMDLDAEFKV